MVAFVPAITQAQDTDQSSKSPDSQSSQTQSLDNNTQSPDKSLSYDKRYFLKACLKDGYVAGLVSRLDINFPMSLPKDMLIGKVSITGTLDEVSENTVKQMQADFEGLAKGQEREDFLKLVSSDDASEYFKGRLFYDATLRLNEDLKKIFGSQANAKITVAIARVTEFDPDVSCRPAPIEI